MLALVVAPLAARADNAWGDAFKAAGNTAVTAVSDGGRTAGRTVGSFFHGGLSEARTTAHEESEITAMHARSNARDTKAATKKLGY